MAKFNGTKSAINPASDGDDEVRSFQPQVLELVTGLLDEYGDDASLELLVGLCKAVALVMQAMPVGQSRFSVYRLVLATIEATVNELEQKRIAEATGQPQPESGFPGADEVDELLLRICGARRVQHAKTNGEAGDAFGDR